MSQSSSAGVQTTSGDRVPPGVPPAKRHETSAGSIKETIDSILIAFIFAFIFRAFVVEAFVIPTGSMAPTLLGAHMRFVCEHCGYRFSVNYSPPEQGAEMRIPGRAYRPERGRDAEGNPVINYSPIQHVIHCANCGQQLSDTNTPKVHYGDRILVLKYLYLLQEPQRWDVVVFKSPYDPATYNYSQNYIKRLIGKPGESIMILDGDIYAGPPGQPLEGFTVQTKPPVVQDALWRIVYDNDYHPNARTLSPDDNWTQPWTPAGNSSNGWDLSADRGRIFRFNNSDGAGTLVFDRRANPAKHALTDWLAYDVDSMEIKTGHRTTYENVTDLKLAFHYLRRSGQGPLRLEMTKFGVSFVAEITADTARLFKDNAEISSTPLADITGRSVSVEFINVDYRVTLRVGDQSIQTTPDQYRPDVAALLKLYHDRAGAPPADVRIVAAKQSAELSHISLWRDVYYLNRDPRHSILWGAPERQRGFNRDGVIDLGANEYFVLGDNSPISGDSRYWNEPIDLPHEDLFTRSGRVPGRFLLGKAFFVYWPAGYSPVGDMPALVPNFGDMRFIH